MKQSTFRRVKDAPGFMRWELDTTAACRVRQPAPNGRIWAWSAWTETGRYENGMAHSKESAIIEAKSAAMRLVAEDLDQGLPRSAQMEWEQGLFVDPHPQKRGRTEEPS